MNNIYLDNSTITRPSDRAVSKMLPFITEDLWGSPSTPHQMGQRLLPSMEESYKSIYKMLGAKDTDSFILTSSGAEAVNHVIFSTYYDVSRLTGKNHFVTSFIDEAPSIMAIGRLEHYSCVGKMVKANSQGMIRGKDIAETISPRTALVSLSWANGLTGVINQVAEISEVCKERGIIFHLDASHVLGKLFFELEDVGADIISFNGANLHAPQGTGGLYIKEGHKLSSFILGGLEQAGLRAGSINVPGLIALGEASKEAVENRDYMCTEVARLRNKLETGIVKGYPEAVIFFKQQERVPHITAIGFPGISNEAMLFALNRKGVLASIGGGNFQQIGLVLAASGIDETLAQTAVSFSLSRETHEGDIDRAIEIVVETTKKLRKLSAKMMPQT